MQRDLPDVQVERLPSIVALGEDDVFVAVRRSCASAWAFVLREETPGKTANKQERNTGK